MSGRATSSSSAPPMTVAEFLDWSGRTGDEARYELIDGEVFAMSRDSVEHNRAKGRAFLALVEAIRKSGVGCEVFIDGIGVALDKRNFRIPDVIVHCGEIDDDAALSDNPIVVVEIISPSSERRDVHAKLWEYFELAALQHYVIVYPSDRYVIHHKRAGEGRIDTRLIHEGDITLDPPGLTLASADLFPEVEP